MVTVQTQRRLFYNNAYKYTIIGTVVTFLGFLPSYFSKLGETDAAHHLHGLTATSWMLLLIIQPYFYANRKMVWHRRIGKLSMFIVPPLVLTGLYMVHTMLNSENYPPLLPYQLAFIDFFTIAQFVFFYCMAIITRKNVQTHARYMVATLLGPLVPALARLIQQIPGAGDIQFALHATYICIEVVLIILLYDDKRSGNFSKVYLLTLILFLMQHLAMTYAARWDWWIGFLNWFAAI